MKIAEIVSTFPPSPGGMGYVCFYNALELARLGHEVTVFTLAYNRLDYKNDSEEYRIIRLKTPFRYGDAGIVPQLYSHLKGFDMIHLHYPFFGGAEYILGRSLFRKQNYFLTYHMDVRGTTFLKKSILGIYKLLFQRKILENASMIGALSLEHLESSEVAQKIDWGKVVEIPNGVDTQHFTPRPKDKMLTRKYGLEGKIVVLFVGNLQPFKGLDLLIEAISRIKNDKIVLLVIGAGYAETAYKKQVEQIKLETRVIFAGSQSHDQDLPAYYNLGDFLVLPSTHSESFGLVVLEGMASEKPAIVSALPGPSQLVQDGKNGFIVKVGDIEGLKEKIETLAGKPEICEQMGRVARQMILDRYQWKNIGRLLETQFKTIIAAR